MKVRAITEQDIRGAKCRGYNPTEWDRTIDRFLKYGNCQFYEEIEGTYEYERFFATYQVPEGMILFNNVSYTTCITNNGFCRIEILADGTVQKHLFKRDDGLEGYAVNEPQTRRSLAAKSQRFGTIFTNIL